MQRFIKLTCGLAILISCSMIYAQSANHPTGKFYIVGMGTAPDLLTLRAQRVIARADVVLFEEAPDTPDWSALIKGKEVLRWPHTIRRFYGIDPKTIKDPKLRAMAESLDKTRHDLVEKIQSAVNQGKVVACLESGDPMIYGTTFFLEMLPRNFPSEIVPGIGSFQAGSAALKMSPPYAYDTSAVILTMDDWPGRVDTLEKLMAMGSTMVFYTMHLSYPHLFAQLQRHYPEDTPVAVVIDAGDPNSQKIIHSTVGRFLQDVDYNNLPEERHILFVGKFLTVGQARKDFLVPRPKPAN